ncbi:MAG: DUF2470 domain-containing protein [Pseudomonadota bacterium]
MTEKDHEASKGPAPFDPLREGRRLVRAARTAALATLDEDNGSPFASLVLVATDPAGQPILLLSDLAVHSANLKADPRVSLLVSETLSADPMAGSRATMTGTIERVGRDERDSVYRRFLAKHPSAEVYSGFSDFSFYRMRPNGLHVVAGFGRIAPVSGSDYLTDCAGCDSLLAAEAEAIDHMNEDHKDALALYAMELAGAPTGDWRATGLDPDGLDLDTETLSCRVTFPDPVRTPGVLRAILKRMADEARQAKDAR